MVYLFATLMTNINAIILKLRLFLDDAETVRLASSFLRARVLATPLMFMSFFTVYLFQAFGKGNISLLLGTVRWLGFNIPMLYLLNHLVGMYGLVWSQVTADSLNVIVSIIVYPASALRSCAGMRQRRSPEKAPADLCGGFFAEKTCRRK